MEHLRTAVSVRYPLEELFRTSLKFFWKTSKKTPLKRSCFNNDEDCRPGNFLKTQSSRINTMIYVAYMLKIISFTGTTYSHKFWENYFVYGWSKWMSFICVQNCSILWILITQFNTIDFFVWKRESYPEHCQTSKVERFVKIVNSF